jgi:hypothetical protein
MKAYKISNVKSRDFLGVVIESTLSWELHIERICSRISHNLFIINRLSKIPDVNEIMLYCGGLLCRLLSHGIVGWAHSAKAFSRSFVLQKRAVKYISGLKHLESCSNSFINLKILIVCSLYIQETILYVKEKWDCTANEQIHTYNTRNNKDYHKYGTI